jgi:hypothetical protein
MSFKAFALIITALFTQRLFAQSNDLIPQERKEQIGRVVELIKNDNISALADMIEYPIIRQNPIPNIENREAFILYYTTLFDIAFKSRLASAAFTARNTIMKSDNYGLFNGEIWLNDEGKIITINYQSTHELELQSILTKEILSSMHPSVGKWKKNLMVAKSDKFLIRVDLLEDNTLRYISWSNNKKLSDKPDLILYNGTQDFHGTIGGLFYTFKNGDWTYVIDHIQMCEDEMNCGLLLRISFESDEKQAIRLIEAK